MFLTGQRIIEERLPDDRCMYLLSSGSVTVHKGGVEVASLSAGAVVGEITVLGLASRRSSTVIAAETCCTQVLHQSIVVRGLELFPEERQKVLMMALKKTGLADQDAEPVEPSDLTRQISGSWGSAGTNRAFLKVLKKSPLFSSISPHFVDELSNAAADRIYMPGDLIIEQGGNGDSMFIMVFGQAAVFITDPDSIPVTAPEHGEQTSLSRCESRRSRIDRNSMSRVGTLHAGSITGELAMLGVSQVRSATIVAETICSMWEVTQERALTILECFPDAQKHFSLLIVKHLERTVPARFTALPMLRGFDRKLRTLLGLYCERKVLFPGHIVCREGHAGSCMFVINLGRATLEKKGITIRTYVSGSHFGSTVMLGVHKSYLGTLGVVQTCHVLCISRASYIQALDHYPSAQAAKDLKRTEKMNTEQLKDTIQRISARKLVWKRYQGLINPAAMDAGDKVLTEAEMISRVFQGWRKSAAAIKHLRYVRYREKHQYRLMMDKWVMKKREAMARVEQKQHIEQDRLVAVSPFRARVDKPPWEPTRLASKRSLPPVTPEVPPPPPANSATPDSAMLLELLKEWPTPRPSPHYSLKIWGVLADNFESPGVSPSPLLPLLTAPPNSAETDPAANAGALCASPAAGLEGGADVGGDSPAEAAAADSEADAEAQGADGSDSGEDESVRMTLSRSYSFSASDTAGLPTPARRHTLSSALGSFCVADAEDLAPRVGRPKYGIDGPALGASKWPKASASRGPHVGGEIASAIESHDHPRGGGHFNNRRSGRDEVGDASQQPPPPPGKRLGMNRPAPLQC